MEQTKKLRTLFLTVTIYSLLMGVLLGVWMVLYLDINFNYWIIPLFGIMCLPLLVITNKFKRTLEEIEFDEELSERNQKE